MDFSGFFESIPIPSTETLTKSFGFLMFVLVVVILSMYISHSVSFPHVYKNVHRKAYALVVVDESGNITLESVSDPYKILTGSTFGGGSGPNLAATNGKVTVTLGDSHYDFTTSTVNASITTGDLSYMLKIGKSPKTLTLTPVGTDLTAYHLETAFEFDLNVEMQQPATI